MIGRRSMFGSLLGFLVPIRLSPARSDRTAFQVIAAGDRIVLRIEHAGNVFLNAVLISQVTSAANSEVLRHVVLTPDGIDAEQPKPVVSL